MKSLTLSLMMLISMQFNLIFCPQVMLINKQSKNDESVLIVDKVIREKGKYLDIDVTIPIINGLSNKKQEEIINNKINKWTMDWIDDVRKIADEYYKDLNAKVTPFQLVAKYLVKNNDNKILSLYIEYYQFTGGAHGITTRIPYNIDIKTGNLLSLNDLFKSGFNYKDILNKEIKRQIALEPEKYFDNGAIFKGVKDNDTFYIEDGYLIMFYGQYELAPYVAGIIEFKIPLDLFLNNYLYGKI